MDNRTDDEIIQTLNMTKIHEYGAAIGYVVFVIVLGVVGNTASIAFYGFRSRRTTTNRLIMYLATEDLIACLSFITQIIKLCLSMNFKNRLACKVMFLINHWLFTTSGCLLVVICVDRYRKICRPLQWQFSFIKMKLCVGIVVVCMCLASARHFVILDVVHTNITVPDSATGRQIEVHYCTRTKEPRLKSLVTISHLVDILLFFVMISTLSVLYTIVAWRLWKYQRIKRDNKLNQLHSVEDTTKDTLEGALKAPRTTETLEVARNDYQKAETLETNKYEPITTDTIEAADNIPAIEGLLEAAMTKTPLETAHNAPTIAETHEAATNEPISTNSLEVAHNVEALVNTSETTLKEPANALKYTRKPSSSYIQRNVTIMMITITATSMLSCVPYFILTLYLKHISKGPALEFSAWFQIVYRSFMINSAINPYIALVFNPQFRRFVKNSFRSILCRTATGSAHDGR